MVLDRVNSAVDKERLAAAVSDLTARVDDWKSLKLEVFGDLLRFGTFTVLKGDGGGKDTEREVRISFPTFYIQPVPLKKRRNLFKSQTGSIRLSVTEPLTRLPILDSCSPCHIQNITQGWN